MKWFFVFSFLASLTQGSFAQDGGGSVPPHAPVQNYREYENYINRENLVWLDSFLADIGRKKVTGSEKDTYVNPIRTQISRLQTIMGMNTPLLVYQCEIRNLGILIEKSQVVFERFKNVEEYMGLIQELDKILLWIKKDIGIPLNTNQIPACE